MAAVCVLCLHLGYYWKSRKWKWKTEMETLAR